MEKDCKSLDQNVTKRQTYDCKAEKQNQNETDKKINETMTKLYALLSTIN